MSLVKWQKQIACLMPDQAIYEDTQTFIYGIIQAGKLLNGTNDRHKLLGECMDQTKPIMFQLYIFNPPQMAQIKGNCREDGLVVNMDVCAICLQEMKPSLEFTETIQSLDCCHVFHLECIGKITEPFCPVCRAPIPNASMNMLASYSHKISLEKRIALIKSMLKMLDGGSAEQT